ncbi:MULTISPECIES: hypothetical protein [unclassified Halomonas]|uniref:hypothetical protein n=1 Tax=unclassified Halomonas TaxID=2609666 RepID=UPI0024683D2A|nr:MULTISPECIES: hypothetical protein [unclassified Halomonas]
MPIRAHRIRSGAAGACSLVYHGLQALCERGDEADLSGRIGRELLASLLPEDARCYFVGPQGFMTAIDRALADLGVPGERRHYEHFGPSRPLDAA